MEADLIKRIREFNRYYTVWLDVMNKDYLKTELSWPESRVLFEIYLSREISATEICERLSMDKSYVSRIIGKFEKNGLVQRERISGGKGLKKIRLTGKGEKAALRIDENGSKQIIGKLKNMDDEICRKLCDAMSFIEETLRGGSKKE